MNKKIMRDHFWIWGHPTNCLYNAVKSESKISPVDGVDFIGAKNVMINNFGEIVFDMKEWSEKAKDVAKVGWVIESAAAQPENVTELAKFAKEYKNIKIGMFDDFFSPTNPPNNYTNYTPELLAKIREELHDAGIEMWVVVYTENLRQYDEELLKKYIKEFDGVSLWFWQESDARDQYDFYVNKFIELTEGKKRMLGCFVYNFCEGKQSCAEVVLNQLNADGELIKKGIIEGVFIHTNAVFGLQPSHPAVDVTKAYLDEHGDEVIE